MKGIILAGGSGTRLNPLTFAVSKQLLPVYDKPMIYYPLSTLMLAGVKEILIISTSTFLPHYKYLLGSGTQWGVSFSYEKQLKPEGLPQALLIGEKFIEGGNCVLILGDNLFFSQGLSHQLQKVKVMKKGGCTIFTSQVVDSERYGVVELDIHGNVLSLEEKPKEPKSNLAITGLYFFDHQAVTFAKQLKPSERGELEIIDLIRSYHQLDKLHVEMLGRGAAWLDTGTHDAMLKASIFVQVVEERQGFKISCPEEIAWRMAFIDDSQLESLARNTIESGYGKYLLQCLKEGR